jgi:predicted transposase YdaD
LLMIDTVKTVLLCFRLGVCSLVSWADFYRMMNEKQETGKRGRAEERKSGREEVCPIPG